MKRHKLASQTTPCVFIGYHWMPGQAWAGDCYVSPLIDHTASEGRTNPRVIRIKGGLVINRDSPFIYLRDAADTAFKKDLVERQLREIVNLNPGAPDGRRYGE
eukprot:12291337-Heterocapsa_arctica.AAC.1